MFLENTLKYNKQFGWIEVICGSMFSGKTEELIRRLKRAKYANLKVEIFKPTVDVRYESDMVVSHDENEIRCTPVPAAANIPILADDCDVIGIDEAQFFDNEIVNVCNFLANKGIRVIVAGLDMDYKGNPFGPMPNLMATAEFVTKGNPWVALASCNAAMTEADGKSTFVKSELSGSQNAETSTPSKKGNNL